jgi:surface antigen
MISVNSGLVFIHTLREQAMRMTIEHKNFGRSRTAKALALATLLLFTLSACDGEQIGTLAGAAGGAAAGRAIGGDGTGGYIGIILGAVVGGYLGGQAGKWLDNRDQRKMSEATQRTLDTGQRGQAQSWSNAETGTKGTVTPRSDLYNTASGNTCRDFEQFVQTQDGKSAGGSGTACKNPDGTWRVVRG